MATTYAGRNEMRSTYACRNNGARCGSLVPFIAFALAILGSFYFGISSTVGIFSLAGQAPMLWPAQPVSASLTPAGFVPTAAECPPAGECPSVNIVVHRDDASAFSRYLQLIALNHGGDYSIDYSFSGRSSNVYTIRLPQEAARELHLMSIGGLPGKQQLLAICPYLL